MTLNAKKNRRSAPQKEEAIASVTEEATKRINVEVTVSFHQRLKLFAVGQNHTISEIVIEALEEYIKKKEGKAKR